ncbi:uncharacterized protein LOC129572138 [Sitodiplosis mosellana]|uniref:uncharacterized protein LOC129572138 n=1 Tax=Sitodiplosis mosellana TaxID=263140 RepID=UPI0024441C0A|nr:uncharacterized protein LOC129572138 [Sitodiplosis mosellana]
MPCIELHILANKWHILKESTFYLNGNDGSSLPSLESSGAGGRPGNPGMNSGNFFGIAQQIVNGNLLTVQLKSGDGGDGQDGTGSPDVEPTFYPERIHVVRTAEDINRQSFQDRIQEYIDQHSNGIVTYYNSKNDKKFDFGVTVEDVKYNYEIKATQTCGPSGIGGSGGKGGYSGYYHFISTASPETAANKLPRVVKKIGSNGSAGDDGRNCVLYRRDVVADTNIVKLFDALYVQDTTFTSSLISIDENREQSMSIISQTFPNSPKSFDITPTLTAYKSVLQENFNNPTLLDIVQKTLKSIDSNEELDRLKELRD